MKLSDKAKQRMLVDEMLRRDLLQMLDNAKVAFDTNGKLDAEWPAYDALASAVDLVRKIKVVRLYSSTFIDTYSISQLELTEEGERQLAALRMERELQSS